MQSGLTPLAGWRIQELWAVKDCCRLRFFSWEPEAWNPILMCHCISEVRRSLWKRSGGHARLPLREGGCGCERRGKAGTAEEGEGGRKELKASQDHREEAAASLIASTAVTPATQRRGESPERSL